jgi:ubiquitin carboxyl-terminal hydrolase 47
MTPGFRAILYSWSFKEAEDKFSKEYCIPLQLQILFGSLQTSLREKCSTKGLTKSFNWHSNEVSYQQDIQEFCRVLFDAIEESFRAINKPCRINNLYQGAMSDYLKCTECGYERNIYSEFMDLSLPIQDPWNNINNSSLQEALQNYVKPEVLDEDNKYE